MYICSGAANEAGPHHVPNRSGQRAGPGWLRSLDKEVRLEIGSDLKTIQEDWPASNRKPLVDSFGAGLYELRTKVERNQYRVLFCIHESMIVLLHGFMKKTQKTSPADIALARTRQREIVTAGKGREK